MEILFNYRLLPLLIISVLVYWKLPTDRLRNYLLVILSLGLLSSLHPLFSLLMLTICYSIIALWKIKQKHPYQKGRILLVSTLFCISIIGIGKYGAAAAASIFPSSDWAQHFLIAPLGLSYFTFRLLQYSYAVYRNSIKELSFLKLLGFVSFFPTLPAGPLETYEGFYSKRESTFTRELCLTAVRRALIGYFKKIVILDFILWQLFGTLISEVRSGHYEVLYGSPLHPLIYLFICFIRAYIDLSAYSDIAIGLSTFFGFRIMENCRFPLFANNLGEFWRRWHISLSNWCRENVFFPVLVRFQNRPIALLSSMLVMGLWHQVSLNRIYWGLCHAGGILVCFRWLELKKSNLWLSRIFNYPIFIPVARILTIFYVTLVYAFAATKNSTEAIQLISLSLKGVLNWTGHFFV